MIRVGSLSEAMVARLKELAADEPMENDDLFGESPDDAYGYGCADGAADLARDILNDMGEK